MSRPLLLDLFCGAGGAAMGYYRAGFDVVGVDIAPQPHYPFEFHQGDALSFLDVEWPKGRRPIEAIHASPPCQFYSQMTNCRPGLADDYPDLVGPVRDQLVRIDLPWVMENVNGAGVVHADDLFGNYGITLCGRMFGLDLYRHRCFESSIPLVAPEHRPHLVPASKAGHWRPGTIMSVSGHCGPLAEARRAMGIDWMRGEELSEAIPPAYTEFIGAQLLQHVKAAA